MVQVIKRQDRGGEWGEAIGGGLKMLIKAKMKSNLEKQRLKMEEDAYDDRSAPTPDQPFQKEEGVFETGPRAQAGQHPEGVPGQQAEEVDELEDLEDDALQPMPDRGRKYTKREIHKMHKVDPTLSSQMKASNELIDKQTEQFESRSFERNKKFLEKNSEVLLSMPQEKLAISQMRGALASSDFTSFRNAFAELLPENVREAFKTESAQVVNMASKQYLMAALQQMTGRSNQNLQRLITKAHINPLYSDTANLLILDGIEGLANIKENYALKAEDEEARYAAAGREVPRNFQQMIRKQTLKASRKFENEYAKKAVDLLSNPSDSVLMIDREGKERKVNKKDVQEANKAGYKVK